MMRLLTGLLKVFVGTSVTMSLSMFFQYIMTCFFNFISLNTICWIYIVHVSLDKILFLLSFN